MHCKDNSNEYLQHILFLFFYGDIWKILVHFSQQKPSYLSCELTLCMLGKNFIRQHFEIFFPCKISAVCCQLNLVIAWRVLRSQFLPFLQGRQRLWCLFCFFLHAILFWKGIYGKCPKILNTKVSDKMTYANSADPDQTAYEGAVWSGSTLFAIPLSILTKQLHKRQNVGQNIQNFRTFTNSKGGQFFAF